MVDALVGLCLITGASTMALLGCYLWLLIQKERREQRLQEELEAAHTADYPALDQIYGGL